MGTSPVLFVLAFLLLFATVGAWCPPRHFRKNQHQIDPNSRIFFSCTSLFSTEADFDQSDNEANILAGPEKSQMTNYILDYLKQNKEFDSQVVIETPLKDEKTRYTHLVGIPMENCHELLLELESVQRAILYHTPILVHACIPQVTTRLPLLLVTADDSVESTQRLYSIVSDVVSKTLIGCQVRNDDVNKESITSPFMLNFQTLELDGSKNDVLQTVAVGENAVKLRGMVDCLRERIRSETGWQTELPNDPHSDVFRPRIPFMRLPRNWEDILSKEFGEDEVPFLTSDQGGNGISPIFWYKWRGDDFGIARMREVAVYKATGYYEEADEQTFRLPYRSIELPMGDANLTRQEVKFRQYEERRILEAERYLEGSWKDSDTSGDEMIMKRTRTRLEALYNSSSQETESATIIENDPVDTKIPNEQPEDPSAIDDWTRERIKQIIASRAKVMTEQELTRRKDKPSIVDNEIFSKYRKGTLLPKGHEDAPKRQLPSFPSREHCTGFWSVVASPTGFMVEEGDSSRSDNLILRVDGTTAGGPILDQVTRQKASGGTWRMYGTTPDDASLVIRLLIPPKKERVLVMKGRLEQISSQSSYTLAGSSFGIPGIEKRKAKAVLNGESDNLLYCIGNVWIEDAGTKSNREEIGTFSLMKLDVSTQPNSYTITIPRPVRNQD